jgi:hypothetical protein
MADWQIGKVKITRIIEGIDTFDPALMLPGVTARSVVETPWLQPHFADDKGHIHLAIQALVVETSGLLIVIDTCVGNERQGRDLPHWNNRRLRSGGPRRRWLRPPGWTVFCAPALTMSAGTP